MTSSIERYTTADAILEALQEMGVSYLFCNFGSDHPTIIEGLAKARKHNRKLPEVIMCPHESVALAAAHGYAQISGEAQAVIVHCDVGVLNLGGNVHNAARNRIPVFIFAGETPYTLEGELPGGRNIPANHLQNVYDQRGILRNYMKWEYDIRTGRNVKQLVYRALQLASSEPKGPVLLVGAREVLEEDVAPLPDKSSSWAPIERIPLPKRGLQDIVTALANANNPLVVTSYLGRNEAAVAELVRLCETLAIPLTEASPTHMNFPTNHSLHLDYGNGKLVQEADVILVIDSDAPWLPALASPHDGCTIYYIDTDPLKEDIPLWYVPSHSFYRADALEALQQMNEYVQQVSLNEQTIEERYALITSKHDEQHQLWAKRETPPEADVITSEWLTACLREVIDEDTIIMNETVTNNETTVRHLPRSKPGTYFKSGGSSLGWCGGASIGAKLAEPSKTIVCLTGDGTYLFSVPSSVHWISRRYHAPFLTVIYNNQGWNATKKNYLSLYPDGESKKQDRYYVNFDQPADLSRIAEAAGGAYARKIEHPAELREALKQAMEEVRNGRSAVIDVRLSKISGQTD